MSGPPTTPPSSAASGRMPPIRLSSFSVISTDVELSMLTLAGLVYADAYPTVSDPIDTESAARTCKKSGHFFKIRKYLLGEN